MVFEATVSDTEGLFSLDISQHGGTAFSKGFDACVQAADFQGQRLAAFAFPTSLFESDVSPRSSFLLSTYPH